MATEGLPIPAWRAIGLAIAVLAYALGLPAVAQDVHGSTPVAPTLRLPAGARPTHYDVTLTIVPGAAKVSGEVAIDVELDRPHPVLWLNAVSIAVSQVRVDGAEAHPRILTGDDQFIGLAFDPALTAGSHRLTLAYSANQNRNSARGIFALQDGGAWYTMTQFEPVAARQAFPCFDEPGFKVPWRLTLRVPQGLTAVSNSEVASEQPAGDGMKVVRFAESRPLPSYLVAFAVGPWEVVDLGHVGRSSTPMRVIAARGHRDDTRFAAQALPELFTREEAWFDIAYPFGKLDHVAIPLGVRFAMENAGLITYGAQLLLQPHAATPPFRHALAGVAAHETAHQWFGNLVTPAWWDDIWLNEAFASWFADKIVDAWQPSYERSARRVEERADAIEADALSSARSIRQPIVTRGDIFNAFDSITYEKGATVIGMFEGWIGDDAFRRGVHGYLDAHRYGSASTADFLNALSASSAKPVASAFGTFLDQNGVPEVGVSLDCSAHPARLALSQSPHAAHATTVRANRWEIPVCVRYGSASSARDACTLVTQPRVTLDLAGGCPAFVFANAGGRGYYVPVYDRELLSRLASNRAALTAPELASFVYDLRPLLRAGAVDAAQVLDWIRRSAGSRDRAVVSAAIGVAEFVRDDVVSPQDAGRFAAFVRKVFGGRARALGFVPRAGESDDDQLLRKDLLRIAAADDAALARSARRLAYAWLRSRTAIDPGLVDTVLRIAARTGDRALFDAMMKEMRTAPDRLDRRNLLVAMMSFGDASLAQRALGLLLDPQIDVRDAMAALGLAASASPPKREPYEFIAAHFGTLAARVDRDAIGGWPRYAEALCDREDREAVDAFWRPRVAQYAGADRNLAQALESIDACVRLRTRESARVHTYLARFH
jgi:alanyl aminopeptidase